MVEEKTDAAEDIKKAFEFALDHVGLDISSYPIWNDYINYLRNQAVWSLVPFEWRGSKQWFLPGLQGKTTLEQQDSNMAMRRVYQRAIVQPIHNVETLWNAYNTFENGLNKTLVRKWPFAASPITSDFLFY